MAPPIPEKIQCTTAAEFASQLRDIEGTLALPETEDNWEKISRALQKFAALVRGGATKLDQEFVDAVKANYKSITNSMVSERGRLSGVATDFVSSFAPRLGSRFEPLVSVIIPALVKLLMRPNKVFVNRAQACLLLIIEHCHLPSIVPHLREAAKDKAQTLRLSAVEATLQVLEHFDKSLLEVREGSSSIQTRRRGNVEDIETIIKDTARDANPTVRQASRKVFEKYSEIWPERVEAFTTPFSPTIRKYLNVNGSAPASKPVAALKVKPAREAPQADGPSSAPPIAAGPSRPTRPKPNQQSASEGHFSNPPSRPASRVDRHGPIPSSSSGAPSGSRSDVHSRTAKYVPRNGDVAVQQPEDRVTTRPASRTAVMARQKPAVRKPDATTEPTAAPVKKAPEPAPALKKMPSSLNVRKEGTQTKKPTATSKPAVGPTKPKTNPPPSTREVPKEVIVAMQVPLPAEEPHEVPLPAAEDHGLIEAPEVSSAPEAPLEATPRAPTAPNSTTPASSPTPSKRELLVDLDQTIILAHRSTTPPVHGPTSVASSNLMDFDMSVVLPDNFAPLPATNASFPVLRDHQITASNTHPVASKPSVARTAKDLNEADGDSEARVALMEKELNILRA
ncbi:hypothetical protein FRC01_004250 [Tulasnella sp. 417]|nr:hypothetical protein FRC01_004250 [Tulasnella sp. 417]